MDKDAARFLGYLGEFCLSIWIFEHLRRQDCQIKELNGGFVVSDEVIIHPWLSYRFYSLLTNFTFGKWRERFKTKKRTARNILKGQKKR
jgi:hypothetical protein